jgi:hypothetical protein
VFLVLLIAVQIQIIVLFQFQRVILSAKTSSLCLESVQKRFASCLAGDVYNAGIHKKMAPFSKPN